MLLLVEVADSSLAYDRDVKPPRYALAGIPEVWLVDLASRRPRVHRGPDAGRWAEVETVSDLGRMCVPCGSAQSVLVDLSELF